MEQEPTRRPPGNPVLRIMRRLANRPAQRYAARIAFMVGPWRRAGMRYRECAGRLNARGIPTFRGRPWSGGRVWQILRDGRCAALAVSGPGEAGAVSRAAARYPKTEQC